jgi:hypothetical protein
LAKIYRGGKAIWNFAKTEKKPQKNIPGDIIQVGNDFYMVGEVGARKIELVE